MYLSRDIINWCVPLKMCLICSGCWGICQQCGFSAFLLVFPQHPRVGFKIATALLEATALAGSGQSSRASLSVGTHFVRSLPSERELSSIFVYVFPLRIFVRFSHLLIVLIICDHPLLTRTVSAIMYVDSDFYPSSV